MTKTTENLQFEIAKLTLKPGDILVLRVEGHPNAEVRTKLRELLRATLRLSGHPDTDVIVMPNGASFEILEHAA